MTITQNSEMNTSFDEKNKKSMFDVIHNIKHYLPSQAPLKDFIHHNTLHSFQNLKFHDGILQSEKIFGYKIYLQLKEFRDLYFDNKISKNILLSEIAKQGLDVSFLDKMLTYPFVEESNKRIGQLRSHWKKTYDVDIDLQTHPILFRYICNFLDQGISAISFPYPNLSFFEAMKKLDIDGLSSVFLNKNGRARKLFHTENLKIEQALEILVNDENVYETYLYDQQFSHSGWSGLVSVIEDDPNILIEKRKISLKELVIFELLLEIDCLDSFIGENKWKPIMKSDYLFSNNLFDELTISEIDTVNQIFQNSYEKTHYEQVLQSIHENLSIKKTNVTKDLNFQAVFCIDDRESSLRMYLEDIDLNVSTYGTPGFFGFEFYFQPSNSNNLTKQCPAPVTPQYVVQEVESKNKFLKDLYIKQNKANFFTGWFLTPSLGYWSVLKLFLSLFRPSITPATTTSLRHMDKVAKLTVGFNENHPMHLGLQIGFTEEEMALRVYNLLMSIGLNTHFAKIVYLVGHGASSVNNPHYSAYDCGACSGRPGSVNARVFAHAANLPEVRKKLSAQGINIPDTTRFVGAIHDTTRDDIDFFDEHLLSIEQKEHHVKAKDIFERAMTLNAKERSRRFLMIDSTKSAKKLRDLVRIRSISLFEPRPELNHATNSLCLVGPRSMSRNLFLDRRAFLNSYDPLIDPNGLILEKILNAAAPVCGGINLEYYFSRVDNQKLGAGTKLPHNVMGLIGVANGVDGDLRPGLPIQMIEVHDPIRLLIVVYQKPYVVLETIQRNKSTYEWFKNEWVHLACIDPSDHKIYSFSNESMISFTPHEKYLLTNTSPMDIEKIRDNIPPKIFKG